MLRELRWPLAGWRDISGLNYITSHCKAKESEPQGPAMKPMLGVLAWGHFKGILPKRTAYRGGKGTSVIICCGYVVRSRSWGVIWLSQLEEKRILNLGDWSWWCPAVKSVEPAKVWTRMSQPGCREQSHLMTVQPSKNLFNSFTSPQSWPPPCSTLSGVGKPVGQLRNENFKWVKKERRKERWAKKESEQYSIVHSNSKPPTCSRL